MRDFASDGFPPHQDGCSGCGRRECLSHCRGAGGRRGRCACCRGAGPRGGGCGGRGGGRGGGGGRGARTGHGRGRGGRGRRGEGRGRGARFRGGRGDVVHMRPLLAGPHRPGAPVFAGRGSAPPVDDVLHLPQAIEVDPEWRLKRVRQPGGHRNATLDPHGIVPEVVVHPHAVSAMGLHRLVHSVADISSISICLRHVVGVLRLVEVGLPGIAGPLNHVLQRVLHRQAVHGDAAAIDHEAGLAGVLHVLDKATDSMVSTPEPEVVTHDVPRVHAHHDPSRHLFHGLVGGASHAGEDVVHDPRVARVALIAVVAPLQEGLPGAGASLQEEASDTRTLRVPHSYCGHAWGRNERGEADAEEHLVVPADVQRNLQIVDAWCEDNVQTLAQLPVDGPSGVCGPGHKDALKGHQLAPTEVRADAVLGEAWDVQLVLAILSNADKWLLSDARRLMHGDSRRSASLSTATAGRCAHGPHEDHVPDAALGTRRKLRVPREVLLLAAGLHLAADPHVAHKAPAGVALPNAPGILRQLEVAVDDRAPHRRGLRRRPEHVPAHAKVLRPTPECGQ
mmetsp:Transcript_59465/g.176946  ORF Transcript_59465/g.176946 Transcript_59465/m.176946 type:complete len:564 (-) Transcript_59465:353-2044(-)